MSQSIIATNCFYCTNIHAIYNASFNTDSGNKMRRVIEDFLQFSKNVTHFEKKNLMKMKCILCLGAFNYSVMNTKFLSRSVLYNYILLK